ncbi:MAG TPA: MFS transporter [Candidatus Scubalenecus merdavium]|uniref:MFS transporter n=1 Tax=Candidatus Scybalenecus merdavium TaxID=2840939 RepID=A0A9D1SMN9_9FIRM|nr:MFS transporter [Candidatus Scubalenecus merdavium]
MAKNNLLSGRVGRGEIAAYGIAGGGQNLAYGLITGYLMYYYVNVFHIDPRVVGLMLFVEGIWDVVNNPLAGMVIDRTRSRHGKMLPYLRWCIAPLAVFTVLLFAGPYLIRDTSSFSPAKIAFMFLSYFAWEIFYTITDVAYWGLSAAISPDAKERRRVMTFNNAAVNVGSSLPFVVVPFLLDYAATDSAVFDMRAVFMLLGVVAGVVGIGLFSLAGFFVHERVEQSQEGSSFRESLHELLHNPGLRLIILSGLIRSLSGVSSVFMTYYFIDVLGYASLSVLVNIPTVITWAFSYALLKPIRRRFDARQFTIFGAVLTGAIWFAVFLIGLRFYRSVPVMVPVLMVANGLFGLINAPVNIVQNEMLADTTDYSEWTTGKRSEGVSFSLRIATTKIGSTVVQAFGSVLLSMIGYVTLADEARVVQSDAVQFRIFVLFALVPGVFYLLSAVPLIFYDLVGEKLETMRAQLSQRRSEQNESAS